MANLTNCTGGAAAALIPFDPLSLCNPDGSDSLIGLPCSSSIVGNIFLIAVYGILLGMGAKWISEGSDLLLEVWGPGLVGGLLLPTLGALPDALVIAMSVIQSTDPAKLQDDLNVGMGTLVGSNVVLLTIPWSMALAYGKVPMDRRSGGTLSAQYKKFHNNQGLFLQDQGGETTTPAKTETKTKTIAASSASSSGSPGIASNEQNSLPSVSSSSSSSSSSDSSSSSGSSSSSDEEHRENYLIGDDTFQMPTMGEKTQRSMLRRRKRRRNRKKARRDGRPRPSRTKRTTPKTTATITTTNNITTLPIISEDVEAEHSQHDADDESEEEDEQEEKEDAVQVVVEMTENKQDEELLDINALKTGGDEDAAAAAAASTPWWKRHDFWCMTGVTIQSETKLNAIFMMGSLLPLVVVQGVAFAGNKEATRIGAIVAVFCCVLTFIWYSYYTIRDPIVQATKRKMIIKKYNGLRFVESIKKRFESGYQETKEGDLGGVGSENDPLLQASDRQYLASRYSVTSRNLNVRRHRGGENGMGVGGGGSGGGSSSSSSHRGSLGGHGLRQRTLARRKSGFNTTVDQLFRDFKKNDPIKRALHIQKKQQKQDKIQTYQDAIVERFEESSIQAPKNTSASRKASSVTTTTTKNDDNTIIMKRQGTLDVLFGRGEEEEQQQQQKKTETNKDVANAVKNEETKVESTAITTKAEETVTVAVNSKNKNKNNKIMRRLQSENMLSTNQQSATSDSNKQKTRTNSGIVYERSRRRRSSSNSCNPRPFISQSLEASLLNQKDVKQAKKNGAAKSTVNALANISLFNLRMVRNMDDIRKEFHQAKDTAVKLSKIGDGKKVEQVRHALFEKMNAGSVDKWSDAHKLAIKRAVFQAWDVALPLLGPTKEERMVQLQKDIALGLKQNDQTPEKMLKIKEMQAELEAEEDTENALSSVVYQGWWLIIRGVIMIFLVADGMVAAITAFGSLAGISSFLLSMVIVPIASNMSELIGTYYNAAKKKKKVLSMLYSMLYGGVVMNNAVSLATFLLCLIARDLEWNFAAETLSVILIVLMMGFLGSYTINYLTFYMIPVLLCFPLAVGLVALFQLIWPPAVSASVGGC